eukprot:364318-Chlamydomonas_euryale.AAC.5
MRRRGFNRSVLRSWPGFGGKRCGDKSSTPAAAAARAAARVFACVRACVSTRPLTLRRGAGSRVRRRRQRLGDAASSGRHRSARSSLRPDYHSIHVRVRRPPPLCGPTCGAGPRSSPALAAWTLTPHAERLGCE